MDITAWNWEVMTPEFIILGTATILSLIDLFMPDDRDRRFLGILGLLGVIAAGFYVIKFAGAEPVQIMNDMFRLDSFGTAFKLIFLTGVALLFILSIQYLNRQNQEVQYRGEFFYLVLTALLGMMIMASSADLITLFVGLEVLSVSSYILVGIRKKHLYSNESAFKYVVSGAIATAITLYGMSFIYGITGTTNLYDIAERLASAYQQGFSLMIYLGFFLMLVGLSFKIAVVPYHMWAPDVYQGAPTPVTAFLSVLSKAAGFAIIIRIFLSVFRSIVNYQSDAGSFYVLFQELNLYIAILAAASMIIGNTLALRQTNIKRLMAYSSIAQAGYILVPLVTFWGINFFSQTLFYLVAYLFMTLGAFAVIMVVTTDRGTEDIRSFAGLYHRSPFTAIAMTIFLLSLAGIPITAGFFGKFYIFMSSVLYENYWLAAVMMGTSIISYIYYFGIIRQMYMRPGDTEARLAVPLPAAFVIAVGVLGTVAVGLFPDLVLNYLNQNLQFTDMFARP
ncbi:MAG: NADH-quinone oxidoreductase subunit NuoN [Bacillaceae bacterium]|nr:NADH-quinone oxidoreductase subunit NuoN [Bacillaceae bacterium]